MALVQSHAMLTRRQLLGGDAVEIASLVVSALPGRREALRERMLALPGLEIHADCHKGIAHQLPPIYQEIGAPKALPVRAP